jgi:hypothetical protein
VKKLPKLIKNLTEFFIILIFANLMIGLFETLVSQLPKIVTITFGTLLGIHYAVKIFFNDSDE